MRAEAEISWPFSPLKASLPLFFVLPARRTLLDMPSLEESYIKKFKEAYERDFSEEITEKEADDRFFRLVRLVRTVLFGAPSDPPDDQPLDPRSARKAKLSN
jgi:hypothetical protein